MRVGHGFREHDHDRVAADIGAPPGDLAVSVQRYAIRLGVTPHDPWFPWKALGCVSGVARGFGKFLPGDATDDPCIAIQRVVDGLENVPGCALGTPAARQGAAVYAGDHQAADMRFHEASSWSCSIKKTAGTCPGR